MNGHIAPSEPVASTSRLPYHPEPFLPVNGLLNGTTDGGPDYAAQPPALPLQPSVAPHPDDSILSAMHNARTGSPTYRYAGIREIGSRTGWIYSTAMMAHKPLLPHDDHPEKPERIYAIYKTLKGTLPPAVWDNHAGLIERMRRIHVREAILEEIRLVHAEDQWKRIQDTADYPFEHLEAIAPYYSRQSLYINNSTALAARLACGSVIDMCRAVAENRIQNGFCIVRPPGHHAEPDMEMGFCIYNNAAVAAEWLLLAMSEKIKRVLILDWDVHHGNGTQKAFYDDPRVLYISIHRHEDGNFYPGGDYGGADKCGEHEGLGKNVNIPWRAPGQMGDADYMYAFQQVVMPIGLEFDPDFVIVSAGFDAALGDPLGECEVTPGGFAHMTHQLSALANGRVVLALEGGYHLPAIAPSALACTRTLLGESPPRLEKLVASESATLDVNLVSRIQSEFWEAIKPLREKREHLPEETYTLSLTDVLKLHRSHYLYSQYNLVNVNLAQNDDGNALAQHFENQVFASCAFSENSIISVESHRREDAYSADYLVLYVHDMGTIHAELNGVTTNANTEQSFLIENTKLVLDWIAKQRFAVIDVNVLPHQIPGNTTPYLSADNLQKMLAEHLWEYFINLSSARNVVFIGQGSGCFAIGHIIQNKPVQEKVKAVVQIPGRERPPSMPNNDVAPGLRSWYFDVSVNVVPRTHELLDDQYKNAKRFGKLFGSDETHPSKVVVNSWPEIVRHLESRIDPPPGRFLGDHMMDVTSVDRSSTPAPPNPPDGSLATELHAL